MPNLTAADAATRLPMAGKSQVAAFSFPVALARAVFASGRSGRLFVPAASTDSAHDHYAALKMRDGHEAGNVWMLESVALSTKDDDVGGVKSALWHLASVLNMMALKIFRRSTPRALSGTLNGAQGYFVLGVGALGRATFPVSVFLARLISASPHAGACERARVTGSAATFAALERDSTDLADVGDHGPGLAPLDLVGALDRATVRGANDLRSRARELFAAAVATKYNKPTVWMLSGAHAHV